MTERGSEAASVWGGSNLDAARRMSIGELLGRTARRSPDKVAFRFRGESRTFAELDARVDRLAAALRQRGIRAGDRVATLSNNRLELIESYLGIVRLGALCVPLNFRLAAPEMAYILGDCGARGLIAEAGFGEVAWRALADSPEVAVLLAIDGPCEAPIDGPGVRAEDFEDVLAAASPLPGPVDVDEHADAFIMYTSGTTGRPKGAVLSHFNLLMNTVNMMLFVGPVVGPDEVELSGNPLFHIAGLNCMLPDLILGGTSVLLPTGEFDPVAVVDMLEAERVTGAYFVPTQWQRICAVPGIEERTFVLRRIIWGASTAPPSVLDALGRIFSGVQIFSAFGQTEMSCITCVLPGSESVRKRGSVGKPLPTVEARIVDPDMVDVPDGSVGEIVYRGPTVMQRYWNDAERTATAFAGGWFHSGDLVRRDDEGFLWVVDRVNDMIISGGENIYCAEVEAALDRHPKVGAVAVIGVPDQRWGETPRAVVVPVDPADPPTDAELVDWCADRLASYKKPTSFVIADGLPLNAAGKVLKTKLRELHGGVQAAAETGTAASRPGARG